MNHDSLIKYISHINSTASPGLMSTRYTKPSLLKNKISEYFAADEFFHFDGSSLRNWDSFSKTMAYRFKFPDYYGNNWNAFNDCMRDLIWLEVPKFFICLTSAELMFELNINDREAFQRSMNSSHEFWREPYIYDPLWPEGKKIPFHVLLISSENLKGFSCPRLVL